MKKLLFVCLGNICRSPAAQGVMQHLVDEAGLSNQYAIDSAGMGPWHVGQLPDHRMRRCGARHGYAFNHIARQVTPSDFDAFDYICLMDEENLHDILRLRPTAEQQQKLLLMKDFLTRHPRFQEIPDPYYGNDRDFDLVIELLEDACQNLLQWLQKQESGVG